MIRRTRINPNYAQIMAGESLEDGDYVDLAPPVGSTTPKTGRRKFKNPKRLLQGRNVELKKPIKPRKLVQMTLKGEKATKPPPKRKRAKKGKDAKPTKQGKLVTFKTKDGKTVKFRSK
jgi:hypothetical protein